MEHINKFQTFNVFLMVLLGIILGHINLVQVYSEYLIMPSLTIMLFLVFIQVPLSEIGNSFKNIKFTLTSIIINFVWTPILIFILSRIFLNNNIELLIGFIMLMVTPCTDWYLIFTGISKGNVTLGSSILPLNLILQLLLLPIYVLLIGGTGISIHIINLFENMILGLIIPLILSGIIRRIIINKVGNFIFEDKLIPKACEYQGYLLNIVIVFMFASNGRVLIQNYNVLFVLLVPILIFFIVNFVVGLLVGKAIKMNYEDNVSLNLTILARNSPIALAIAVTSFPDKPLISLALIIGPLIELPVLFLISKVLLKIRLKEYMYINY